MFLPVLVCGLTMAFPAFAENGDLSNKDQKTRQAGVTQGYTFTADTPVQFAVSKPLKEIAAKFPVSPPGRVPKIVPRRVLPVRPDYVPPTGPWLDPALQPPIPKTRGTLPSIDTLFSGQGYTGFVPPDTNGDVGPSHYVQTVNSTVQVFSKTGTSLLGPVDINSLWSGAGGSCATNNDGDPYVLYDQLADRWILSQFSVTGGPPYYQCIAISRSGDPTGQWYLYTFRIKTPSGADVFDDYPKFGIWPDAYYMTYNTDGGPSGGIVAFERSKMLTGDTGAQQINASGPPDNTGTPTNPMLPADWDGTTQPLSGTGGLFTQKFDKEDPSVDNSDRTQDEIEIWEFHVNWTTPSSSTFTKIATLIPSPFDSNMCNRSFNCIPQPGTSQKLDAIADWSMVRLQYRNFGSYESMVFNHTVDVDGSDRAGIRWYEIRRTGGTWSIYQQGTYSPDSTHRWMGSMAMDQTGNIALGYSASSSSVKPGIRYTGRRTTDTLGTLLTEGTIFAGLGSQTTLERYGDYSGMNVDPTDDCTFWYTTEYILSNGQWATKIANFKFPSCGPTSSGPTSTPTPGYTPVATAVIPNIPTVGAGTPTPFATLAVPSGSLANVVIGVPGGEFNGATVIVAEVTNVPPTFIGTPPAKVLALRITEAAGCVSGITVSFPVPSGVTDPRVVIFINGKWVEVTTTVSGGVATGRITCTQLGAARATSKEMFGFDRAASDIVIVGLADRSQLAVPSLGLVSLALLLLILTVFMARRRLENRRG